MASSSVADAWQRQSAETVASQGTKVWIRAEGHLPRFFAYASQHHPLSVLKAEFYCSDERGDYTILVGFGPEHGRIDVDDLAGVQAAVDAFRPGIEVTEATAHDWMTDPLARNTWMTHRPGQLTRDLERSRACRVGDRAAVRQLQLDRLRAHRVMAIRVRLGRACVGLAAW